MSDLRRNLIMISIKPTTYDEIDILTDIQKQAFKPLYDKYRDASNPYLRGREDIEKRLCSDYFKYFTIYCNNEIVGGVLYRLKGSTPFIYELKENECYLTRVYIKPEMQNLKIGRTAICLCEKELIKKHIYYVDFPQDLEKNRRCYESVGFKDTKKRLETDPGVVLASYIKEADET